MKHLTRRKFAKTMACEIGAWSVLLSLAVATAQAQSAASEVGRTEHSLENKFGIALTVEPNQGLYSIRYQGERWLGTGVASVLENKRWYRSADVKYPETNDQPQGKLLLTGAGARTLWEAMSPSS
jgi:hypothetical protein